MIARITRAYIRRYIDNGQTVAYVEWLHVNGETGRTEGCPNNPHMRALIGRACREGLTVGREVW